MKVAKWVILAIAIMTQSAVHAMSCGEAGDEARFQPGQINASLAQLARLQQEEGRLLNLSHEFSTKWAALGADLLKTHNFISRLEILMAAIEAVGENPEARNVAEVWRVFSQFKGQESQVMGDVFDAFKDALAKSDLQDRANAIEIASQKLSDKIEQNARIAADIEVGKKKADAQVQALLPPYKTVFDQIGMLQEGLYRRQDILDQANARLSNCAIHPTNRYDSSAAY